AALPVIRTYPNPAVDYLTSNIGGFNATNNGFMFIALKPKSERDKADVVIARLRRATAEVPGMTAVLGGIWLFCCLILLLPLLAIGQAVTSGYLLTCGCWASAALFFLIKTLSDRYLLGEAASFFKRPDLLHRFLYSEVLHLLYMTAIGLGGLLKKRYEWKGRQVK
ncbi:MAG TPA: hypothetical protein PK198_10220, partial [Saprospiraceae bacterium]|nr:hypothetical protein [Saprospiraceae bacterium]